MKKLTLIPIILSAVLFLSGCGNNESSDTAAYIDEQNQIMNDMSKARNRTNE